MLGHLVEARRQGVCVERPHRRQRPEDDHVQRSVEQFDPLAIRHRTGLSSEDLTAASLGSQVESDPVVVSSGDPAEIVSVGDPGRGRLTVPYLVMTSGRLDRGGGEWVLAAAILGSSMAFIDGTAVNVALPALQSAFRATLSQVQWVVESYALTLAAALLTGGSLGDLYGRRRVFAIGVLLFSVASAGCGLSRTIGELIAARGLQGIGGALLVPNSLALVSGSFAAEQRGRAIGTWSGFTSITAAIGPVLGGWLVQHASWRWVFFLNIPLAAMTLAITMLRVPETSTAGGPRSLDELGTVMTTAGLGAVVYGLIESAPPVAGIGACLLIAFVFVEDRVRHPMVPLSLFRSRTFTGANLLTLFLYTALSAVFFFLPSAQSDSDPGLFDNAGRRGLAAFHPADVPALTLGRRSHPALRRKASARPGPPDRRCRIRAARQT
jgi:MFS family permease